MRVADQTLSSLPPDVSIKEYGFLDIDQVVDVGGDGKEQ